MEKKSGWDGVKGRGKKEGREGAREKGEIFLRKHITPYRSVKTFGEGHSSKKEALTQHMLSELETGKLNIPVR